MSKQFNKHWYNNGVEKRKFVDGKEPAGWVRGQLPRSKEHSEKIRAKRKENNSYQAWNKGKKIITSSEKIEAADERRKQTYEKNGTKCGRKKGSTAWNKGLKNPYKEGTNQKISTTLKERYANGEIISATLGKKASEETLKKLRDSHIGKHLDEKTLKTANEKRYRTQKKNKTFHTSLCEKKYEQLLINKFSENDVVKEYKEERYPFKCDFYIKSKDLFIELNIFPTW